MEQIQDRYPLPTIPRRRRVVEDVAEELELLREELTLAARALRARAAPANLKSRSTLQMLERETVRFDQRVDEVAAKRRERLRLEGEDLRRRFTKLARRVAAQQRRSRAAPPRHPQLLTERNLRQCKSAHRVMAPTSMKAG